MGDTPYPLGHFGRIIKSWTKESRGSIFQLRSERQGNEMLGEWGLLWPGSDLAECSGSAFG